LGVLVFHLDKEHKYNSNEAEFLKAVADILALIIYNRISEQKEEESQRFISSAKRIAGLANWEILLPSRETYWSDEIYNMLGYNPTEVNLDDQILGDLIHPDDRDKLKEAYRKAEEGIPYELELRFLAKDGRVIYVISKCTPQTSIDGKISKLSGTIYNITEIREKQQEILEQEAFIESIAADSPYIMYLLDIEEKKVLFTNRLFTKKVDNKILVDFENDGKEALEKFYHPEDLPAYKDICEKVFNSNEDYFHILARMAYDGKNFRWINQRIKPFKRNEEGKVTQVLYVSMDMDDQKKAEEKTRELNEQLLAQNTILKKMNNELDRFIYSVSHDIRAPLSSMIGLVNLYNSEQDWKVKDLYVEHIDKSISKLENFVAEIVDFSKNSKTELTSSKIMIEEYVKGIFNQLEFIEPTNRIKFEFISNGIKEIETDEERLGIILRNIISNSIKYSNHSKESYIRCKVESNNSSVFIHIIDNGIGIEESQLEKVFDMFYRACERSQGSGLGLYIARETAETLGGNIRIESKFNVGTEIILELPAAIA
jgi:PAS domain S-box-containing protein